jgi:hypothetical protein
MHRPLFIAALLLLLVPALSAQHGGGHASAGGHGGGTASHGGFSGHMGGGGHAFGGTHSSGATRSFGGVHSGSGIHTGSGFAPRTFGRGSSFHSPIASRGHHHSGVGVRIRTRDFRNNCWGYGCAWWGYGYPYLGGGIDPYWWWDSDSYSDQDQQYQSAPAYENDPGPRDPDDQDGYARTEPPRREPERTEAAPATVLVFRDQHRLELQNYAIVGQTLWNFAPQHTQKIPLSDLDLAATTKANDERGVDFRVPGGHEGQ